MPYRETRFASGEHYHLCVRGNNKQSIFKNDADRARLLFLILHMQSPVTFEHIERFSNKYLHSRQFFVEPDLTKEIIEERYVTLEAFAFMTNHIHFALKETQENGIVRYMQRILNGYAKYFNTKHEMVGHLFQGPYRAIHIENNEQLLYLSTYIHRNPRELPGFAGREHQYEWSSYQDYVGDNRFKNLLDPKLVLEQFDSPADYRNFVTSSTAKETTIDFLTA